MDIRKFFAAKGDSISKPRDEAERKNAASPIVKRGAARPAPTPPRTSPRKAAGVATSKNAAKPAAVRSLPVSTAEVPSRRSTTAQDSAGVAAPASLHHGASRSATSQACGSPAQGAPASEEIEETSDLSDYEKVITGYYARSFHRFVLLLDNSSSMMLYPIFIFSPILLVQGTSCQHSSQPTTTRRIGARQCSTAWTKARQAYTSQFEDQA